ncbi:MAG: saccharopine dehydrogenase NADP-binding domain-containing protein, partial [Deltaproteobacteria bacterium]|nr:saccharopine dehydrogenase NADP-binding domain-containing protein [Deltaproteobacteria bacterium]
MGYRYVVLGSGRQGVALAYDLALNCEADSILMVDIDPQAANGAVERLKKLLPNSKCEWTARQADISAPAAAAGVVRGADVALSAAHYRLNERLTEVAIRAGVSLCDLGGNTDVVRRQLDQHAQATAAGVSIVPDCGLAPGLGNLLGAWGVAQMDAAEHVHVRCGGLPQEKVGPLNYKLVFNFDGLINEYSGLGEFLRNGKPTQVPTLTELEPIDFPDSIGKCEAAVTSGGTSTCPETFRGKLQTYDYKTVRYPGHYAIVKAMFDLGCFEERVALKSGGEIQPKPILRSLIEERLTFPEVRDLVVLRATIIGRHQGQPRTLQYDLYDRHDEKTGLTAMERTTAFPTTLVAYMQARKLIEPGARPLERSVPLKQYFDELPQHGIRLKV